MSRLLHLALATALAIALRPTPSAAQEVPFGEEAKAETFIPTVHRHAAPSEARPAVSPVPVRTVDPAAELAQKGRDVRGGPASDVASGIAAVTKNYSSNTTNRSIFQRPTCNTTNPSDPYTACSPSSFATSVRYVVSHFRVSVAGTYAVSSNQTTSGYDGVIILYRNAFEELSPRENLVAFNDDDISTSTSRFTVSLQANTTYLLVTTGFTNEDYGAFTNTITGPDGTVIDLYTERLKWGASTANAPTFRLPFCDFDDPTQCYVPSGDTPQRYRVHLLHPQVSGYYGLHSDFAVGYGVLLVYAGGFDPNFPIDNLHAIDGTWYVTDDPDLTTFLMGGQTYVVVTSQYHGGETGAFSNWVRRAGSQPDLQNRLAAYQGTTVGGPTFNRPSCSTNYPTNPTSSSQCVLSGVNTRYRVSSRTFSKNETIDFASSQQYDGYLFVYRNTFDPTKPRTNLVAINDDATGGIGTSDLRFSVVAGTTYHIVTAGFGDTSEGRFYNLVFGGRNAGPGALVALADGLDGVEVVDGTAISDEDVTVDEMASVGKEDAASPDRSAFALAAAGPNPFGGRTAVALTVGRAQGVHVAVYDVVGRQVARLHDGPLDVGTHTIAVDASALAAGVYVVRASGEAGTATLRLTLAP